MARVLLVDDDLADLTLLRQALQEARPGVDVRPARTRAEAMAQVDGVDLVLLDLNMPGTSGFEILKEIRHGKRPWQPVIVLTTSAASSDIDKAYELGANAFITKPEDLMMTIDAMRVICDFWLLHVTMPMGP